LSPFSIDLTLKLLIIKALYRVICWHENCHTLLNPQYLIGGAHMANRETGRTVDERGAAVLLGITPPEVRWFSRVLGLGHRQEYGDPSQIVFTYEELKRLSSAAAASAK
jgi:hypothetical protein